MYENEIIIIAIIGVGPRGVSILERILMLGNNDKSNINYKVLLIEPNEIGCGVHGRNQNNNLLVNTVACQITMFGDESVFKGKIRKDHHSMNG